MNNGENNNKQKTDTTLKGDGKTFVGTGKRKWGVRGRETFLGEFKKGDEMWISR